MCKYIAASVITCCESVAAAAAAAEDACTDVSADVAFIVDASGSVGEDEWKQVINNYVVFWVIDWLTSAAFL